MNVAMDKRFTLSAAAGALALCAALILPSSAAQAAPMGERFAVGTVLEDQSPVEMQRRHHSGHRHGGYRHRHGHHHHHRGRGYGGNGALIGAGAAALILGGAAAAAAASQRECWIERRWVDGPYGPERRNVRICE
ncbi:hypothetical protein [Phreatobacter stygius]|uniref:hypothetical protein n=1 Tax=Phreatobacter stygius TaxID=1940610 RepID=UPI001B8B3633|nr:hypothetical protein [Phreatobacter stygius]